MRLLLELLESELWTLKLGLACPHGPVKQTIVKSEKDLLSVATLVCGSERPSDFLSPGPSLRF